MDHLRQLLIEITQDARLNMVANSGQYDNIICQRNDPNDIHRKKNISVVVVFSRRS